MLSTRISYLFLIVYTKFVYWVNAVTVTCYYQEKNLPFFGHTSSVDCDIRYEECCETGCCKKSNGWPWFLLLIALTIVFFCGKRIYSWLCDLMFGENSTNEGASRFTQGTNRRSEINSGNVERPLVHIVPTAPVVEGGTSVESSTHPITPPPSYDAALLAPTLRPEDRIPSYEDVMKGNSTKFT